MSGTGRLEGIFVTPEAKGDAQSVDTATATAGRGLEGDRYADHTGTWWKPDRTGQELTLIEVEALDDLASERGILLTGGDTRRNLLTRGIDLASLIGRRFRIGDVE